MEKPPAEVPFLDLAAAQLDIDAEVQAGWAEVVASSDFANGAPVAAFEDEFAAYCGAGWCAGVGNGTDALELALRALGVGPGDEVVVPANSFIASAEAVSLAGARPVFCDVDPQSLLVDVASMEAAITPRTAALLPVHLYGQVAPMDEVLALADKAGLAVVEDAAQAQGAALHGQAAGSFGDLAATSFYPGKNLGAYGEAGAVLGHDPELRSAIRALRSHGGEQRYVHDVVGRNSRMDSLQAVVLLAKLRRLDCWNDGRRAAADRYRDLLGPIRGVQLPVELPGARHVWHLFVVQIDERDRVREELSAHGIGVGVHYPSPIHLLPAYAHLEVPAGAAPAAEAAAARILSLPMFPHLEAGQQERVAEVLASVVP